MSYKNVVCEFIGGVTQEYAFIRFRCKFVKVILVVNHKASTTKNVKEADIGFTVVETFIGSVVQAFANDASILNKACSCHYFSPKVERKDVKVQH